jgi:hypothetical protein
MALSDHDQARIRDYLLGKLSETEQEQIEERLMVEDDFFEEFEILKGELVEEYREGQLTPKEQESFKAGFLSSPEGRKSEVFALAIGCLERKHQPQPVTLRDRLAAFFRKPQWAFGTLALAAAVIIAALVWIRTPQQPAKFVAVTLTSNAVKRSNDNVQYPKITIPADVSEVRITLALPQPAAPGARYRVELDDRRNKTSLQPSGQDANSVSVVIPARHVPPGFYALVIYEIKADGSEQQFSGPYFFLT